MLRYVHGSEDSLDLDVYYVVDELPDIKKIREFCGADPEENRNLIVVKDGVVVDSYMGTPDEINNALLDTYDLHPQTCPLCITRRLERNIILKQMQVVRGIMTTLSRTKYRSIIKPALKQNWSRRVACVNQIRLAEIDYTALGKKRDGTESLKVIAFQIGQGLGLLEGCEFYTKSSMAAKYPKLRPFLYRETGADLKELDEMLQCYMEKINRISYEETDELTTYFPEYGKRYEFKCETEVSV